MLSLLLTLFVSQPSFAFLDFVGEQAKQATEIAAYTDAVLDLTKELSPDDDIKTGAEDVRKRAEAVRSAASSLRYLSYSTKSVLKGPDWTSKRLDSNIRATTDYVRRVKRLLGRVAVLGTDGAIALNTMETNVALNEVQRNQQAVLLQVEEAKLREIEKEQEESRTWSEFSERQRKLRNREEKSGKL